MFLCESFIKVCSNSEQPHLCPGLFEAIWVILHTIFTEPMTSKYDLEEREFAWTCAHSLSLQSDHAWKEKSQSLCDSHRAKLIQRFYNPDIPLALQPLLPPVEHEIRQFWKRNQHYGPYVTRISVTTWNPPLRFRSNMIRFIMLQTSRHVHGKWT